MTPLAIIATVIFISFNIPMAIVMIKLIKNNRKPTFNVQEQKLLKQDTQRKLRKIAFLFLLMILTLFVLFFTSHLVSG
jgi:hypothetical protein